MDGVELVKTSDDTDVVVNGSFEQFQTGNIGEKGTKGTKGDKGNSPTLVSTNMVLHLDATNPSSYVGTGTQWSDLSGQNNHGTLNGGISYVDSEYMDFDGQDGTFVEMTNGLTLNRNAGTLCFDLYKDAATGSVFWGGNYDRHFSANSNIMYGETASNCNSFNSPTFTFNTGQWYQITLVFSANTAHHYVDGSYIGETPNYGSIDCGAAASQLEADFLGRELVRLHNM